MIQNKLVTNPEDPEIFQYCKPIFPEDCYHNISPSSIEKFFTYPILYYKENIMDGESKFQGSTATVLGSILHKIYECVTKYGNEWEKYINRDIIQEQLMQFITLHPDLNIDANEVLINYPAMAGVVVNGYILKCNIARVESEKQIVVKLDDSGIYLGGTIDRIEGDCVVDFKNVGKLPSNTTQIPFGYKIQLLAYAYALRKLGYEINRIRVVYGIRPTKTIAARCIEVTEDIDFVAEKLIKDTLNLITESVILCRNRPEFIHLIFKSMDLRQ